MAHRLASRAADDLDEIWFYVATASSSVDAANRVVDSIVHRLMLLSRHPYLGRARSEEFGPGTRSFPVGEYMIIYCVEEDDVLILRIVQGQRDVEALLGP